MDKVNFAIYKEAPTLLKGILDQLVKPCSKPEMQRRKIILNNLIKSLNVCAPGMLTHLINPYSKLIGDVNSSIMDVRREIATQVIVSNLTSAKMINADNIDYEIHYVNSVLNYFSYELGLQIINDFYAPRLESGASPNLRKLALSKIKNDIELSLTLSKIMDYTLSKKLRSIIDDVRDINLENYVIKVEFINEALNAYGKDNLFSIERLVHFNEEGDKLIAESEKSIESQITATLMARFIDNGWLDTSKLKQKKLLGMDLFIPQDNYNLSYVVGEDGQYQGLYNYLDSLLRHNDDDKASNNKIILEVCESLGDFDNFTTLGSVARNLPLDVQINLINQQLPKLLQRPMQFAMQMEFIREMRELPTYVNNIFMSTQLQIVVEDFNSFSQAVKFLPHELQDVFINRLQWDVSAVKSTSDLIKQLNNLITHLNNNSVSQNTKQTLIISYINSINLPFIKSSQNKLDITQAWDIFRITKELPLEAIKPIFDIIDKPLKMDIDTFVSISREMNRPNSGGDISINLEGLANVEMFFKHFVDVNTLVKEFSN